MVEQNRQEQTTESSYAAYCRDEANKFSRMIAELIDVDTTTIDQEQ